jgi:hypothetical protein
MKDVFIHHYKILNKFINIVLFLCVLQTIIAFFVFLAGNGVSSNKPIDTSELIASKPFQWYVGLFNANEEDLGIKYIGRGESLSCELTGIGVGNSISSNAYSYTSKIKVDGEIYGIDKASEVGEQYDVYNNDLNGDKEEYKIDYYLNSPKSNPNICIGALRTRIYKSRILMPSLKLLGIIFIIFVLIKYFLKKKSRQLDLEYIQTKP